MKGIYGLATQDGGVSSLGWILTHKEGGCQYTMDNKELKKKLEALKPRTQSVLPDFLLPAQPVKARAKGKRNKATAELPGVTELHYKDIKGAAFHKAIVRVAEGILGTKFKYNKTYCPNHSDNKPSLSIQKRRDGETRIRCFSNKECLFKKNKADGSMDIYDFAHITKKWTIEKTARKILRAAGYADDIKILMEGAPVGNINKVTVKSEEQHSTVPIEHAMKLHEALMSGTEEHFVSARKYLFNERGITEDIAKGTLVGFRKKLFGKRVEDFLSFPVIRADGEVLGFVNRVAGRDKSLRYVVDSGLETSEVLHGLNLSAKYIAKSGEVFLVEGPIDFLQFYDYSDCERYKCCVATLTSCLSETQLGMLLSLGVRRINIMYDNDTTWATASRVKELVNSIAPHVEVYHARVNSPKPDQKSVEEHRAKDPADMFNKEAIETDFECVVMDWNAIPCNEGLYIMAPVESGYYEHKLDYPSYEVCIEDLSPLLTIGRTNPAGLMKKLVNIRNVIMQGRLVDYKPIRNGESKGKAGCLYIAERFLSRKLWRELGSAVVLWLYCFMQQAKGKYRKGVRVEEVAEQLGTTMKTVQACKRELVRRELLSVERKGNKKTLAKWKMKYPKNWEKKKNLPASSVSGEALTESQVTLLFHENPAKSRVVWVCGE